MATVRAVEASNRSPGQTTTTTSFEKQWVFGKISTHWQFWQLREASHQDPTNARPGRLHERSPSSEQGKGNSANPHTWSHGKSFNQAEGHAPLEVCAFPSLAEIRFMCAWRGIVASRSCGDRNLNAFDPLPEVLGNSASRKQMSPWTL